MFSNGLDQKDAKFIIVASNSQMDAFEITTLINAIPLQ